MKQFLTRTAVLMALLAASTATQAQDVTLAAGYTWQQQTGAPGFRGKQDDIHFINPQQGWYVNGAGQIFKTTDGGAVWTKVFEQPGTYFRCIGFVDSLTGYAGNIGTDYFPGVTDTIPLYKTTDGGKSWQPVPYTGPRVKGLCAIEIVRYQYINAGKLDTRLKIVAGGRVGSPAFVIESTDEGRTFRSYDVNALTDYILDIHFFNENEGIICGAKGASIETTNAVILQTKDGGKTWTERYRSTRPYELTWKGSFPTDKTGFVTLQSYNPDTSVNQRYVLKTTDGGASWQELPLIQDHACREFGVGFVNEQIGWVGGYMYGLETLDGGATWRKVNMGIAANKVRVLKDALAAGGVRFTAYAIGTNVYKLVGTVDRNGKAELPPAESTSGGR